MKITKYFKEGIMIMKKFGTLHALCRFKNLLIICLYNSKSFVKYKIIKPKGAVIKNILGNNMFLDMNDYGIHKELFLDGIKEPVATAHLMRTLSKDDIVLEVGANIGYYALIESRLCNKIYAVEPVYENFQYLETNIKINRCNNVGLFQIALGDKVGKKEMYLSKKCNWHSFYPPDSIYKETQVKMDTIDNFLSGKEKPTFIRMDVEGYELAVLKGAYNTLKNVNKLFIEIHSMLISDNETKELINILKSENFYPELIVKYDRLKIYKILPNNYLDTIYNGDKGVYEVFFKKA